jgi:plastocyanin domain-containing protein
MLTGALTFFLPCGFTQAMQLYAMSTGHFWSGAMIMGVFALGTAPGLLGIGGLTSVIQGVFAKRFFKFAGLLVIFLAVFNIANGWNLTGWKMFSGSGNGGKNISQDSAAVVDGVQTVNITQSSSGYSPNNFTVKKGIPVKWVINSTDSQTCAASIIFSEFNIRKALKSGQNVIEFTPTETGNFKFSCSMGMYRGTFRVIDNPDVKISPSQSNSAPPAPDQPLTDSTPEGNPTNDSQVQVVQATFFAASYGDNTDIRPNEFTVKANQPVRFEIKAETDGEGCMSTIMVPGLANQPELLEKGKTVTFNFTATKKGTYNITCAMGVPRGKLNVI